LLRGIRFKDVSDDLKPFFGKLKELNATSLKTILYELLTREFLQETPSHCSGMIFYIALMYGAKLDALP